MCGALSEGAASLRAVANVFQLTAWPASMFFFSMKVMLVEGGGVVAEPPREPVAIAAKRGAQRRRKQLKNERETARSAVVMAGRSGTAHTGWKAPFSTGFRLISPRCPDFPKGWWRPLTL